MIADSIVKQRFTDRVLAEEARDMLAAQRSAVAALSVKTDSGALMRALNSSGQVHGLSGGASLRIRYPLHIRFLDMHGQGPKGKGYPIYNRIVYGHIYGNLIRRLAYGFSEEVKQALIAELRQLAQTLPSANL